MRKAPWLKDIKRLSYADMTWSLVWLTIYVCFLCLDIVFPNFIGTAVLKYAGIFLCVVYAHAKYRKDYNLQLALAFTLLADTILVWTPFAVAGVFVFCFAQFMHFTRLTKLSYFTLGIYCGVLSLILAIAVVLGLQPIYAIGIVYGVELISNLVMATKDHLRHKQSFNARCAFYGFILFICCDVCVAIRFIAIDTQFPDNFIPLVSFLVWVFYFPSQILIANSGNIHAENLQKSELSDKI